MLGFISFITSYMTSVLAFSIKMKKCYEILESQYRENITQWREHMGPVVQKPISTNPRLNI